MFVAYDNDNNRIYADEADKGKEYFCPSCGKSVKVRRGEHNKVHFAHQANSQCPFDKDSKTEWHRRMQDYFPREAQERRFTDDRAGEVHIADVYIEEMNTVLEFQHSPIKDAEFLKRTIFHLNSGRRTVWLFDETSTGSESELGRFKDTDIPDENGNTAYKWNRCPRKVLDKFPFIKQECNRYSVCVYTGTEGDVFRRIVEGYIHFSEVVFSDSLIHMRKDMDISQFFGVDDAWRQRNVQQNAGVRSCRPIQIHVRAPRKDHF